jgi:indolepyruvate ferredoxin oxidoreductase beta subunit
VTSHVRYGEKVHSPLAKINDVDILVSFEKMETLRYLDYVKETGTVIINTEEIYPPAVNLGELPYPGNVAETVRRFFAKSVTVDATALAHRAGNIRVVNTVLLGTLSSCLSFSIGLWKKVLQESFSSKLIKANREAFLLGRDIL